MIWFLSVKPEGVFISSLLTNAEYQQAHGKKEKNGVRRTNSLLHCTKRQIVACLIGFPPRSGQRHLVLNIDERCSQLRECKGLAEGHGPPARFAARVSATREQIGRLCISLMDSLTVLYLCQGTAEVPGKATSRSLTTPAIGMAALLETPQGA